MKKQQKHLIRPLFSAAKTFFFFSCFTKYVKLWDEKEFSSKNVDKPRLILSGVARDLGSGSVQLALML